jgi:mono/diheme cytochrome c family protein
MLQPGRARHVAWRYKWWLALAVLVLPALGAWFVMWRPALAAHTAPARFDAGLVERGAGLSRLGMCAACHTADPARPFAGGRPLETPFGTVYSTNITPDAGTGIGLWSEAAFTRAMRQGVSRDGRLLYPAFPYRHYTRLAQEDISALYAYFMTRPALDAPARENQLTFPFGLRPLVGFWNLLYLDESPWHGEPRQSPAWNRGAYLAGALAHCSACHTPRTPLGGPILSRQFDGGDAGRWHAPALNAGSTSPAPWTRAHLADYLRTGIARGHAIAAGPMRDVVAQLGQANRADVDAIATYIHSYLEQAPPRPATASASLAAPGANDPDQARMRAGYALYATACARCHDGGRGASSGAALALRQAPALYHPDPRNLIHIIRDGVAPPPGEPGRWMPGFGAMMSDAELAALAAYLRVYGARAAPWPELDDTVRETRQP